ncbi:MAG: sigma-70 family RNA polymerase sigma factor [Mycoplasmatota bacterium]|nr:sigma-70 family RNA polymerase sigma factor [Mycoplasmatota bacterium]
MSKYKVDICGVNTSSIKVLSNEENYQLFEKMHQGDPFAREDLINGNLKLVLSALKKFNNKVDNLDDLFQVGTLGLVKAIDNFDMSYGVTLSTYAYPLIEGEMKRYIRDNISLRISRSVKDLAHKISRLKEELTTTEGTPPKDKEIADILGVSEYDIANALNSLKEPVSMYEPIYNDGGDTIYLCDQLAIKEDVYDKDLKLALEKAMEKLKKRELQILKDRFLIGKTQMEIADELGISQAQISRIEKSAITNIKKLIR